MIIKTQYKGTETVWLK